MPPSENSNVLVNPVLERMRAGEVALGMNIRLGRSGDIAAIAKTTGHDFLFIDSQHAIFSNETLAHIAQAARGCGVAPFVRVRSYDDPNTSLLLDAGVTGIVFPDVNTAAEARKAVDSVKFPPIGKRSVAGAGFLFDFRPMPMADTIRILNETTVVMCMIETMEGLENVESIAAIEGVDVLHIGCNDLLVSMGAPGAFGGQQIVAAIDRVIKAAADNGKYVGLGGDRDVGRQVEFIGKGVNLMTTHTDIGFLMAEASRRTAELRKALGKG